MIRSRAAFLGLLLVGVAVVAGAGTNDVQINLGPTYPQTIELQDGTNTLSVLIAAQSVLQITNLVCVSESDFDTVVVSMLSFLDAASNHVFNAMDLTSDIENLAWQDVYQAVDFALSHSSQYNLSSDTVLLLQDVRSAADSILSRSADLYSELNVLDLDLSSFRDYYESLAVKQEVPVLVYADMTLSPASDVAGCDCAEMLGYIYQLLESIDARVALSNTTLADFKTMVHDYLYAIKEQLNHIQADFNSWYGDWSDVIEILAFNGLLDLSWDDMQQMIDYVNTVFDIIQRTNGGSGGANLGLAQFAYDLAKFYDFWSRARAVAVSNVVDLSGQVPLLVEVSNPVTNDWPLAWAVTNFVDYATGEKVPLLVIEDTDGAMDDMEDRADALTRSDADITHWERFPTGIDWEDIKRKADFSDFQVDDRPNRIKVVDGYDFSWSWGSESDSQMIDYGYWDLSSDESGFFRYVHDFFKAVWYFVVGVAPCIFLFWWAFVFGVRATYFGYALLTGRDTARAFARLGALRGFLGDAS